MEHFVEFEDVCKYYQTGSVKIAAADHLNFYVDKGEFCIIVGPSGAGKTTLLNILGGMDTATSGHVMVDGSDITTYGKKQLTQYRRTDIGFVFQFYNLVPNLTALENVELASQISRNPLDAGETLKKVGLEERMSNFPAQLSGGEQQRVAIARALINSPEVLLADEPTGALDSRSARSLMEQLSGVNREDEAAVLMVTHDAQAASFCSRILFIQDGKVFHELRKRVGEETNREFYERILSVMAQLGGGSNYVL